MLADAGFDLAHRFATAACPWLAAPEPTGILVGNTRALWPKFVAGRRAEPDPLDRYTERALVAAFPTARTLFAHRQYDGAFVSFQRVAVATGFAALAPSQLAIHPIYGPWFALRAIVFVDEPPPAIAQPIAQPCTCAAPCRAAFATAMAAQTDRAAWLAVRDACGLRAHRYDQAQIDFHYRSAFPDP